MRCLIADDEPVILKDIKRTAVKVLGESAEIYEATNTDEVLEIVNDYNIQIAFLDIEMPFISGIEVAKQIKKAKPHANIIFVTGYAQYALEAFEMYASAFIMKPISEKRMREAIENLRYPIAEFRVKCFGDFEVFYDGTAVNFKRSQSKEVLAYLIGKAGVFVSEEEIRYLLWDEKDDTEKKRKYVRNIISDIRAVLKEYDMDDVIINNNKASYAIKRDKISCDLYDYLDGKPDIEIVNANAFMHQYSWGEEFLEQLQQ